MSGEISVIPGYEFNLEQGETLSLEKVQRLVSDMVLQVVAQAITERELADGAVTADKLDAEISGQLGLPDGSVTTAKLASTFLCPVSKGGTGATTAAAARTNLEVLDDVVPVAISSGTDLLDQNLPLSQNSGGTYTYKIEGFAGTGVDPDAIRVLHVRFKGVNGGFVKGTVAADFGPILGREMFAVLAVAASTVSDGDYTAAIPIAAGQTEVEFTIVKGTATSLSFEIFAATQRVVA